MATFSMIANLVRAGAHRPAAPAAAMRLTMASISRRLSSAATAASDTSPEATTSAIAPGAAPLWRGSYHQSDYTSAITMKLIKPLYGSSKFPELSRKTKSPNTVTVFAFIVVSRSNSCCKI